MYSEIWISRILLLITMVAVMLWIFAFISRRWSIVFWWETNIKRIIYISIWLILILSLGMILINTNFKMAEIFWSGLVWIIYAIRVIFPLLIIIDILSIRYKVPPRVIFIICTIYILLWLYQWIYTKTTPVTITNNKITENHKIVFISDLHVDAINHRWYIQRIVHRIQKIQPDFVVIGGDLMNIAKSNYVDAFLPFNDLDIPVFATLGNHDHMWNANAVSKIFETTKIIPLRNESREINWIQIVGIDDKSYRSWKNLDEILQESKIQDNNKFTIFISHQPQHLKKLDWFPIDLELAWHTHNGQFMPLSWIIHAFNDYAYWTYVHWEKTAFVSQGIGSRWAPIRMGTQSELVVISLKKEQK
jgi:uncharacterized protein